MKTSEQTARYQERGFTRDQAEVIAMMHAAAGTLFRDFPESFLLFGGATLLMFYESVRLSADLDLLERSEERPTPNAIQASLEHGLASVAEALNVGPLHIEVSRDGEMKVLVKSREGAVLFKVDITRFGSVLDSEIREYTVSIDEETDVQVKAPSRDFMLLQKAECFLLRRVVKVRDAFDIRQLRSSDASLSVILKAHLADTLIASEVGAIDIGKRIDQIDEKHCTAELRPLLPTKAFENLARQNFKPLRDALLDLYRDWL